MVVAVEAPPGTGTVVAAAVNEGAEVAAVEGAAGAVGAGVVGSVPVVVGAGAPGTVPAAGPAGALASAAAAGVWPVAYCVSAVRRSAPGAAGTVAPAAGAADAWAGSAGALAVVGPGAAPDAEVLAGTGWDAVGTATVSTAAISEAGSETDPPGVETEPSADVPLESLAPDPTPDASASAPVRFPPFVEVCLLWPSASAVRATWVDRTLAKASVGGAPPVGGLVPWPSAEGGAPVASGAPAGPVAPGARPAPGAPAAPADAASGVTTGISDADPMPGLMRPSGEIR